MTDFGDIFIWNCNGLRALFKYWVTHVGQPERGHTFWVFDIDYQLCRNIVLGKYFPSFFVPLRAPVTRSSFLESSSASSEDKKKVPKLIWPKTICARYTNRGWHSSASYPAFVCVWSGCCEVQPENFKAKVAKWCRHDQTHSQCLIDVVRGPSEPGVFTQWRNQFNGPGMANGTPHDDDGRLLTVEFTWLVDWDFQCEYLRGALVEGGWQLQWNFGGAFCCRFSMLLKGYWFLVCSILTEISCLALNLNFL